MATERPDAVAVEASARLAQRGAQMVPVLGYRRPTECPRQTRAAAARKSGAERPGARGRRGRRGRRVPAAELWPRRRASAVRVEEELEVLLRDAV
jgi:hypothetical protein